MSVTDNPREHVEALASAHANAVEGFYANYVDALESRDRAVLACIDAGWPKRFVARSFHLSPGRVTQIVAKTAGELEAARARARDAS